MYYLYDVWVNWFEEEHSYDIHPYHEWRRTDKIELLEQIPLLYVTGPLYHYIENYNEPLPEKLLNYIYERTTERNGQFRKRVEYASVITDGKNILAFHTCGKDRPKKKSRLIPRQERQVYERCEHAKQLQFSFELKLAKERSISNVPTKRQMFGLTRRERELKKILFLAMEELKKTDNVNELCYWLIEWDHELIGTFESGQTPLQLWQQLYTRVQHGWSEAHERFCAQLVKGRQSLYSRWEKEQAASENTLQ